VRPPSWDAMTSACGQGRDVSVASLAGLAAPDTHEGRRLIAHELTHVVQQSRHSESLQRSGEQLSTTEGRLEPAPTRPPASLSVGLPEPECGTPVRDAFLLGAVFENSEGHNSPANSSIVRVLQSDAPSGG
jgi:hypothetical protein